jgi:hypothetical protein
VIPVIKNAVGISEERMQIIRIGRGSRTRKRNGRVFSLVTTVGKKKPVSVRVLILKFENSNQYIFYSVMKDKNQKTPPQG